MSDLSYIANQATAYPFTMSFVLDPILLSLSQIPPEDSPPSEFYRPSNVFTLSPLSHPETNPSVVVDIDSSTAIETVHALLFHDFSGPAARAAWLYLVSTLFTDTSNGVRQSLVDNQLPKFRDLSPAEQANLDTLNLAIEKPF